MPRQIRIVEAIQGTADTAGSSVPPITLIGVRGPLGSVAKLIQAASNWGITFNDPFSVIIQEQLAIKNGSEVVIASSIAQTIDYPGVPTPIFGGYTFPFNTPVEIYTAESLIYTIVVSPTTGNPESVSFVPGSVINAILTSDFDPSTA